MGIISAAVEEDCKFDSISAADAIRLKVIFFFFFFTYRALTIGRLNCLLSIGGSG